MLKSLIPTNVGWGSGPSGQCEELNKPFSSAFLNAVSFTGGGARIVGGRNSLIALREGSVCRLLRGRLSGEGPLSL